jgi:acetyl-CoA acetyltransferase family protein
MACISSNKAISDGFNNIALDKSSAIVAGGVETMSDLPIKLSKALRLKLFESRKWKSIKDTINGVSSLNLKDIGIETPSITEFSTNETMGYSADKLSQYWGVSRQEQDEFAVRSHLLASKAQSNGLLSDVKEINVPENIKYDNIIKHDSSLEKLSKLKPAFIKNFGSITAGNASSLTDGASACLITNKDYIDKYNLCAKSEIIDYIYYGSDPKNELLLGPAYATSLLLEKNNLKISDIDVIEFHEAFAGQVLANLNAMDSNSFKNQLNLKEKVGMIPLEKINTWGGSLSLGHPFAATGVRLLTMASNRLIKQNGDYGLITACAAGGLGHAMLIKNVK